MVLGGQRCLKAFPTGLVCVYQGVRCYSAKVVCGKSENYWLCNMYTLTLVFTPHVLALNHKPLNPKSLDPNL